ncbi:MAG: hypothetical protein ACXW28_01620 [Thermoanaerobaculia bacterium]
MGQSFFATRGLESYCLRSFSCSSVQLFGRSLQVEGQRRSGSAGVSFCSHCAKNSLNGSRTVDPVTSGLFSWSCVRSVGRISTNTLSPVAFGFTCEPWK